MTKVLTLELVFDLRYSITHYKVVLRLHGKIDIGKGLQLHSSTTSAISPTAPPPRGPRWATRLHLRAC